MIKTENKDDGMSGIQSVQGVPNGMGVQSPNSKKRSNTSSPSQGHRKRASIASTNQSMSPIMGDAESVNGQRGRTMSEDSDSENDEEEDGLGKKSKMPKEMDDEEKRRNFLERNRQAALKCRQRKKQWLANLQSRVEFLTNDNDQLQATATSLREEVIGLKTLLLAHKDCPVAQTNGVIGLDTLPPRPPGPMAGPSGYQMSGQQHNGGPGMPMAGMMGPGAQGMMRY